MCMTGHRTYAPSSSPSHLTTAWASRLVSGCTSRRSLPSSGTRTRPTTPHPPPPSPLPPAAPCRCWRSPRLSTSVARSGSPLRSIRSCASATSLPRPRHRSARFACCDVGHVPESTVDWCGAPEAHVGARVKKNRNIACVVVARRVMHGAAGALQHDCHMQRAHAVDFVTSLHLAFVPLVRLVACALAPCQVCSCMCACELDVVLQHMCSHTLDIPLPP